DADHRPPVLPLGLLPRAEPRALRARHPRYRLRRRRAAGDARPGAQAAAAARAHARPARADPHAAVIAHVVREAAGEPRGTIVLLHGRGADEHDLLPLLGVLDPHQRYRGITLGGPLSMPPGGKHWYAVHRVGWPDPATFSPTYAAV